MIKVLSDRVLVFDRAEKTSNGKLVTEQTTIGFCSLPDWVAETDYYKAAVSSGILKVVSMDTSVAGQEKIAALEKELAEMRLAQDKASTVLSPKDLKESPKTKTKVEPKPVNTQK